MQSGWNGLILPFLPSASQTMKKFYRDDKIQEDYPVPVAAGRLEPRPGGCDLLQGRGHRLSDQGHGGRAQAGQGKESGCFSGRRPRVHAEEPFLVKSILVEPKYRIVATLSCLEGEGEGGRGGEEKGRPGNNRERGRRSCQIL